ncbi:hypothetical protein B296_00044479 [Ensete ventricosum]|uniref:Uncharacterized protein n=1 Tax=Ensete ventricosum TaxID=4639 RepID=A0A426Z3J4_ENSVE|nr:hypothetical protein B296_00044479 [Ensete ventricosum]
MGITHGQLGIEPRAKVFVRKIGFKLRVMTFNRVESFYAFLLRFRSESSKERGWLAMSRPSTRAVDHGQATCRGGRPRLAPLQGWPVAAKATGAATSKRQHSYPRPGRKERLLAALPQGATARGTPARGGRQQGRWCRLQGWPPLGRVGTGEQGQPSPAQGQQLQQRRI